MSGYPSSRELIPLPMHGDDVFGLFGIVFKLLPQPGHVDVHGARRRGGGVTPDVLQEFFPAYGPAPMLDEITKQLEFLGRKRGGGAIAKHLGALHIDAEGSKIVKVRPVAARPASPAEQGLNARQEFGH